MSKIGSMVFDLQEQADAEFFGQPFTPPAKTALVLTHERITKAQGPHNRPDKFRKIFSGFMFNPVVAELNFFN